MLEFNPPPGWPQAPRGWVPPDGWAPDPAWPPAPEGWRFYVETDAAGPPVAPRRAVWIALAACLALVVGVLAVRAATGYESFDVVQNGFSYRVAITDVDRPVQANGLIAKPGFAFVRVVVSVENRQSDRNAPAIDGVAALAAPPARTTLTGTSFGPTRYCAVGGAGPGTVSTGVAGAPPGWCFFDLPSQANRMLAPGETVSQTYDSAVAFPADLDAGELHVYGRTGGSDTARARDLDLGTAG